MTVRDIAKLANVSPATVSLAINNKPGVSESKKKEILGIIKNVGFTVIPRRMHNEEQKNLVFLKLVKSGILIEQNADFISKIMYATQAKCKELGYTLQIDVINQDFRKSIENFNYTDIAGIFVIGTEIDDSDFETISCIKVPYIVIDNSMPNFFCNSITMSNEEMTYDAIRRLSLGGEKRFGHFRGRFTCQNFFERETGVRMAVRDFQLDFPAVNELLLTPTVMGSYTEMKQYLKNGVKIPRIVFADNDLIAIGAMKAMEEAGIRIPTDVAIIGFDDVNLAETTTPSLSTVHVQCAMIGMMAAVTLTNEIQHRNPTYFKTKVGGNLVIRASTL